MLPNTCTDFQKVPGTLIQHIVLFKNERLNHFDLERLLYLLSTAKTSQMFQNSILVSSPGVDSGGIFHNILGGLSQLVGS